MFAIRSETGGLSPHPCCVRTGALAVCGLFSVLFHGGLDHGVGDGEFGGGAGVCEHGFGEDFGEGAEDAEVIGGGDFEVVDVAAGAAFAHEAEGVDVAVFAFDDEGGGIEGVEAEDGGAGGELGFVFDIEGEHVLAIGAGAVDGAEGDGGADAGGGAGDEEGEGAAGAVAAEVDAGGINVGLLLEPGEGGEDVVCFSEEAFFEAGVGIAAAEGGEEHEEAGLAEGAGGLIVFGIAGREDVGGDAVAEAADEPDDGGVLVAVCGICGDIGGHVAEGARIGDELHAGVGGGRGCGFVFAVFADEVGVEGLPGAGVLEGAIFHVGVGEIDEVGLEHEACEGEGPKEDGEVADDEAGEGDAAAGEPGGLPVNAGAADVAEDDADEGGDAEGDEADDAEEQGEDGELVGGTTMGDGQRGWGAG